MGRPWPRKVAIQTGPTGGASSALVRVVYVSSAARQLRAGDLDSIADVSERGNRTRGLTGLLLYGGRRFYGVLEGPQRRVFACMERIIVDPRHHSVRIVREDAIRAQRFANWSFGSMEPQTGPGAPVEALESFILGVAGPF